MPITLHPKPLIQILLQSKLYLPNVIVVSVPSAFVIFPTGTQTNWLPAVAPDVASSITIPLSTVVLLMHSQ